MGEAKWGKAVVGRLDGASVLGGTGGDGYAVAPAPLKLVPALQSALEEVEKAAARLGGAVDHLVGVAPDSGPQAVKVEARVFGGVLGDVEEVTDRLEHRARYLNNLSSRIEKALH